MVLIQISIATVIISLIAFVGIFTFLLKQELLNRTLLVLVALSTGALLGGAFLHLLPEALVEKGVHLEIFLYLLLGFSIFFVLEQFLQWRHQHTAAPQVKPFSYLILVSDAVHNFIDGLIIAASFVTSFSLGVATTLAVALHEIPQELGDFAVLVYGGFGKKQTSVIYLLPFAAGNFIYIAAADLIPEIKHQVSLRRSILHFGVFVIGIAIMLTVKFIH
jgi:zinc and cadmium transporter